MESAVKLLLQPLVHEMSVCVGLLSEGAKDLYLRMHVGWMHTELCQAPVCTVHKDGERGLVHVWSLIPQGTDTGMAQGRLGTESQLSTNREVVCRLVRLKSFL